MSWTTLSVLNWTSGRFAERGISAPRLEAEVLLAHVLKTTRVGLYTSFDKPLQEPELAAYRELIKRRLAGEPVAYLVGEQEFWSLPLFVDARVLIPRRDTETLVEVALNVIGKLPRAKRTLSLRASAPDQPADGMLGAPGGVREGEPAGEGVGVPGVTGSPPENALEGGKPIATQVTAATASERQEGAHAETSAQGSGALSQGSTASSSPGALDGGPAVSPRPLRIADIATGSGAVALALAKERPDAQVVATDLSEDALAVARANIERHGLGGRVELRRGDLVAPIDGEMDLIVSNPPYVPSAEISALAAEVREEPRQALDGGPDGLGLIRRLVPESHKHLVAGGTLAIEHGYDQGAAVRALFEAAGYKDVATTHDLAGNERVTSGKR